MNKTWLIIQREFSSRVKKRSFLIMTILGPILFGALMIAPALIASIPEGPKVLVVLDESALLTGSPGDDMHELRYLDPKQYNKDKALELLDSQEDLDALFYIPVSPSGDPDFWKRNASVYGKEDISLSLEEYCSEKLETAILEHKLLAENVNPEVVANARTKVKLKTFNLSESTETESVTEVKIVVGYAAGFMIYIFIFLYAAQIMRGVIEEKSNRIVEVLISSVKPFQLMVGKVVGIGFVGVLQFTIWVVLSMVIFQATTGMMMADQLDPEKIAAGEQVNETAQMIFNQITSLPISEILLGFLFYFIGGYMLYGALFAAVGAAVDSETDTQQFMTPLVIPLVLALIVSSSVIENPHSDLAFWFSMVPFTSPIVMMVRIPFDVPTWQLILSMVLLIGGFLGTTWMAGRIYRVGILMYGKKTSYKEIWKWIRYRPI
ncbi:MAG: ABC transporter permease [Bacteroidetes bacterium]|nr:MAG: ABC transporter permease [Bacteroidota bacterium]